MMKRAAQILLGIILLLRSPLVAQESGTYFLSADSLKLGEKFDLTQGYFYLTQNWRYRAGDPAEAVRLWANADFADSSWEMVDSRLQLDQLPQSGWNGSGWFRLHLTVDSLLLNRPLAFNLFHYGASEVYLDGVLLYQFGKVSASRAGEAGFNAIGQQPKFIVFRQTKHLIAVRYSGFNVLRHRPPTMTELGFRMGIGDLNHSQMLRAWHTRFFTFVEALTIAVPLSFAILHFLLFLFYRRDRANFYFAMFTATIGLWGLLEHRPFYVTDANSALLLLRLISPYVALMPLVGLRCLYSFFYLKLPRQFWIFAFVGIGLAIWTWFAVATRASAFFFLIALLEMVRVVIVALRRKAPGAWIIGAGFAAFSLSLLAVFIIGFFEMLGVFAILSLPLVYALVYGVGVLGLLLSMSIYLSHNIARTNKSLEAEMKKTLQLEVDNARHEVELQKAAELKAAYQELDAAHTNLQATQQQLVTQEKLASLGQLTAGIAHEIKNPLNFVNNFAALSVDLAKELREEIVKIEDGGLKIEDSGSRIVDSEKLVKIEDGGWKIVGRESLANIKEILETLEQNAEKINHHGKRADGIVKSMMQHARGSSGQRELTDINHLLDEAVNLTYHGMRANDASFNITIEKEYDESIGRLEVVPQDLSRVFLNMINNACYAAHQKKRNTPLTPLKGGIVVGPSRESVPANESPREKGLVDNSPLEGGQGGVIQNAFSPTLSVSTKNLGSKIEIRIRDNGNGIPAEVREKIFNPFFTTKPTGQGTGLGLSISYDIVVQQHRGEIKVETEEGKFTEFVVRLPKS